MRIEENKKIKDQKHDYYADYELRQFLLIFENPSEKVIVQAFDENNNKIEEIIFQAKFINTHLNIQWQDKGEKSTEPLYEWIKVPKEKPS